MNVNIKTRARAHVYTRMIAICYGSYQSYNFRHMHLPTFNGGKNRIKTKLFGTVRHTFQFFL